MDQSYSSGQPCGPVMDVRFRTHIPWWTVGLDGVCMCVNCTMIARGDRCPVFRFPKCSGARPNGCTK